MSINFPRLDPNLIITTGVEGPTSIKPIEAIKQDAIQKLFQNGIGKQIQGEVLAKLGDGSFVANVNGTPMRLALPTETQIGAKLSLTLLHLTPRPVFLLNGQHQVALLNNEKAPQANSLTLRHAKEIGQDSYLQTSPDLGVDLQKSSTAQANKNSTSQTNIAKSEAPSMSQLDTVSNFYDTKKPIIDAISNQFVAPENVSSKTELSTAGQLINKLLQETSQSAKELSISGKTPLLTEISPLPSGTQLARHLETQLRQNISNSGLFYESHVVDWVIGKKTKDQLQNEPQAQIALNLENSLLTDSENQQHTNLAQIIHQQLGVLEHQKLSWSGQLATEIPMQWTIEESPPDSHSPLAQNSVDSQRWHSYLRVELPNLGIVAVQINLDSGKFQLDMQGENLAAIPILRAHFGTLKDAVESTGTTIQSITARHHEQI